MKWSIRPLYSTSPTGSTLLRHSPVAEFHRLGGGEGGQDSGGHVRMLPACRTGPAWSSATSSRTRSPGPPGTPWRSAWLDRLPLGVQPVPVGAVVAACRGHPRPVAGPAGRVGQARIAGMPYSAISSVCSGGGCSGASARCSAPVTALLYVPTASMRAVRWWSRGARSLAVDGGDPLTRVGLAEGRDRRAALPVPQDRRAVLRAGHQDVGGAAMA